MRNNVLHVRLCVASKIGGDRMKRSEIVALSRAATKRVKAGKVGVVHATKYQLQKLADHKRKKQVWEHRRAAG